MSHTASMGAPDALFEGIFEQAGIFAAPHLWGCTPKPFYCAHLAAGVGNVLIVEGIPGRTQGVDYSNYRMRDGKLVLPETPGFGLELVE